MLWREFKRIRPSLVSFTVTSAEESEERGRERKLNIGINGYYGYMVTVFCMSYYKHSSQTCFY